MVRAAPILGLLLIPVLTVELVGECREEPAIQMDEEAAESHLLAKRNPELPREQLRQFRAHRVVVLVTVNREGAICYARAVSGPEGLRQSAERAVREHWKYRPFLVNWKPVFAQFPVTVDFVRPGTELQFRAGLSRQSMTAATCRHRRSAWTVYGITYEIS